MMIPNMLRRTSKFYPHFLTFGTAFGSAHFSTCCLLNQQLSGSAYCSVSDSVPPLVLYSVYASVFDSVFDPVSNSGSDSVSDLVSDSVSVSVHDSVSDSIFGSISKFSILNLSLMQYRFMSQFRFLIPDPVSFSGLPYFNYSTILKKSPVNLHFSHFVWAA